MPVNSIAVVGGGWSVRYVDIARIPGDRIIAVNEAGVLLPKVNDIVSMDRLWTENRWDALQALRNQSWLRRSALQNIDWLSEGDWVHPFDCDHESVEFSEDPLSLNGTNSGTCALNLAYIQRPQELYLFGFDMCHGPNGNPYWFPVYPWARPGVGSTKPAKYKAWAGEMNSIALKFAEIDCRVLNVSEVSQINCWQRVSPKQLGIDK